MSDKFSKINKYDETDNLADKNSKTKTGRLNHFSNEVQVQLMVVKVFPEPVILRT